MAASVVAAGSPKYGTPGQYPGRVVIVGADAKGTTSPSFLATASPAVTNMVLGNNNNASRDYNIIYGQYITTASTIVTAMGHGITSNTAGDTAFGFGVSVGGQGAAFGYNTQANNGGAAFGFNATANGSTACAFGPGASASGGSSFAMGGSSSASGFNSMSFGYQCSNSIDNSMSYGSTIWPVLLTHPTGPAAGHAFEPRSPSSNNTRRRTSGVLQGLAVSDDSIFKGFYEVYVCDYTGVDRPVFRAESDGAQSLLAWFGGTPVGRQAALPDTAGATLAALETEVNRLKALIRAYNLMAP
jgi:hypothetical protein